MTTYYAIRIKKTDLYLPQPILNKRGYTAEEPTNTRPPRLFVNKAAAMSCLNWWFPGRWGYKHQPASMHGPEEWYLDVFPVETRKKEDMEIIAVTVTVKKV